MTELQKMKVFIDKGYTYNAETGEIFTSRGKVTKVAGKLGYLRIMTSTKSIDEHPYELVQCYSHRFAYFYYYGKLPEKEIDHINGNRADNRIVNLRDVSHRFNMAVSLASKGYQVYDSKKCGRKYYAKICIDGRTKNIGTFTNEADARNAYLTEKYRILKSVIENKL